MNQLSRRQFTKLTAIAALTNLPQSLFAKTESKPLFTSFGVCTDSRRFPLLKKAGYSYVEDATGRLLMPAKPDAAFDARKTFVLENKIQVLACNSFVPGNLRSVGKKRNHEAVLSHATTVFKRAAELNLKGIVFGSAGSRKLDPEQSWAEGEAQFVELLKKMAPLAEAHQIEIWLEPLNRKEDTLINTQKQGAAVIEKVNHPSLGLVCDLFHVARNEEPPQDIQETAKFVRHGHIAEKEGRLWPGANQYDFTPYLKALEKGGYSGTMSMECRWTEFEKQLPLAIEYVRGQIQKSKQ